MRNLTSLFDEVVGEMVSFLPIKMLRLICKILLRKLPDQEENRELKGISQATGVDMYLLVCFNVLLDLLMGCSSGGARVQEGGQTKMVHFRTLDWGMPSLRKVLVQLDFKTQTDGPIVASSITYAGFVGVLTGARQGLSVSLNFRPSRNNRGKFSENRKYVWHLLMVLLGKRRSIASELRSFLLPRRSSDRGRRLKFDSGEKCDFWGYQEVVMRMTGTGIIKPFKQPLTTTACYLCFCNGSETAVIEKDRVTSVLRTNNEFIVITNNDLEHESNMQGAAPDGSRFAAELAEIVDEAKDRRECAEENWKRMRVAKTRRFSEAEAAKHVLKVEDVVELVQLYPTTNEMTHFACVMDPVDGTVRWCRRWIEPVTGQ